MSLEKQLNYRMFLQREENRNHVEFEEEYALYHAVASGDIETVKEYAKEYKKADATSNANNGVLSKNPLQNTKYHFVIFAALITRLCVENGMEREKAYTLSDLYINQIDTCTSSSSVLNIQGDLLLDFTTQMSRLEKEQVYSIQVSRAIDYIYRNLQKKLSAAEIAETLHLNASYLSKLFKKETNQCISQFIRQKKVQAASNMLKFSEYSYSDIAEYFCFTSQSYFIQCFKKEMGCTPKEYREKNYHKGMEI
ncbi:MAG: AraC family transcriptional regulator [Lachnospiraceae bacterium]|jgi:AraC-like DNA-binding protein|nr:AraC family transcriptional regulator [Lachnospiraceae bacterium]